MDMYTYQYLVTAKAESGPCSGERDIETWPKNMTSFCPTPEKSSAMQ